MPKPRKSAFDAPYIEIIDRLIARRHELGMTQTDLALAYGEDQSFISRVERRQRRIDVYEFVRMCRALRLDPTVVLQDIEPEGTVTA
jgi:transcriptional regulator with XRE-family HTH domain